jgi:queuine tRNA-ribosyltransferase
VKEAVDRTSRWMERCLSARNCVGQALFGIVQGGIFDDLREESARFMISLDMPGYSIGGLSVGESKADMYKIVGITAGMLPDEKPRYLMGVGSPEDIVENVARGIDMFDCVLPTRVARNAALFTSTGRVNVNTSKFRGLESPVEEGCSCYTCQTFSVGYLHHLFKAREYLAYRLASIHNITFLNELIREIRESILAEQFQNFYDCFMETYIPVSSSAQRTK